ncbi:Cell end marker Tea3 [Schizosaccharomyces pombe]|uniref:Tip elongation aberrant protein 3 n=1 Tax=Schizosaccharomyces pombe (strain 972 / ATCC 24843) TaxID=284812 RepID=TEA3_SCHPO|nr:cell end marker Tea3 [Schizosaccharomyces pombe]O14248.1 RecName: Full=Tip elongation aberrant protein 3; AltName: Full=Cell polarity protein tea3 [Schizosaccharomyces pombe 972h-]CAB11288.1 cell end marker Tea3 [Schizosaccharomyces pombe]|eukprot:NP_594099.1 cell end marker Tea3 [Schizosaccharomyces pombe]
MVQKVLSRQSDNSQDVSAEQLDVVESGSIDQQNIRAWVVRKVKENDKRTSTNQSFKWEAVKPASCLDAANEKFMYLHGGREKSGISNSLFKLDLDSCTVYSHNRGEDNDSPARVGHSIVCSADTIYLFGGCDSETDSTFEVGDNSLYAYNFKSNQWNLVSTQSPLPSPRTGHSMLLVDSKLWIFGGECQGKYLNDIHLFDTKGVDRRTQSELKQKANANNVEKANMEFDETDWSWETPFLHSSSPPPRSNHSVTLVQGKIFVHGGHNDTGPLSDLWLFDLETLSWTEVRSIGRFPGPREGHQATTIDDTVYIYGGRDNKGLILNELWAFNYSQQRWSLVSNPIPILLSDSSSYKIVSKNNHILLLYLNALDAPKQLLCYEADPKNLYWDKDKFSDIPVLQHISMKPSNASNHTVSLGYLNDRPNHSKKNSVTSTSSSQFNNFLEQNQKAVRSARHRHYASLDEQGLHSLRNLSKTSGMNHSADFSLHEFGQADPFAYEIEKPIASLPLPNGNDTISRSSESSSPINESESNSLLKLQSDFKFSNSDDRVAWLEEQLLYCMQQGYTLKPPNLFQHVDEKLRLEKKEQLSYLEILKVIEQMLESNEQKFKKQIVSLASENAKLAAQRDAAVENANYSRSLIQKKTTDETVGSLIEKVGKLEYEVQGTLEEATSYYQKNTELQQLLKQNESASELLKSRNEKLCVDYDKLRSVFEEDSSKILSLQKENENLQSQILQISEELVDYRSRCEALEYGNYELETKLIEMHDRVEMQTNVIEASASALDVSNTAILSFEDSLRRERDEKSTLQQKCLNLQYEYENVRIELENLQSRALELESALEQSVSDAKYSKAIMQSGLSKLLSSINENKDNLKEFSKSKQKISYLESQLEGLHELLRESQRLCEGRTKELLNSQQKLYDLKHSYSSVMTEKSKLSDQVNDLTEQAKITQRKLSEVQIALADSKMNQQLSGKDSTDVHLPTDFSASSSPLRSYFNEEDSFNNASAAHSSKESDIPSGGVFTKYRNHFGNLMTSEETKAPDNNDLHKRLSDVINSQQKFLSLSPQVSKDYYDVRSKLNDTAGSFSGEEMRAIDDNYYASRIKQLEDDYQKAITYANCSDESFQQLSHSFM